MTFDELKSKFVFKPIKTLANYRLESKDADTAYMPDINSFDSNTPELEQSISSKNVTRSIKDTSTLDDPNMPDILQEADASLKNIHRV